MERPIPSRWAPVFLFVSIAFLSIPIARSTQPEHESVLYVASLDSPERVRLSRSDSQATYAPPGFLISMVGNALLAQPFALHHLVQKRLHDETIAPRIVGRHIVEVASDHGPNIQAHDIEKPVTGALGQPDQLSRQRIHFFDGVPVFDGDLLNSRAEERADPVGDKVGRIFAGNHSFAQPPVAEILHEAHDLWHGFFSADYFQQMQIARRIEEVSPQEVAAKFAVEKLRRYKGVPAVSGD